MGRIKRKRKRMQINSESTNYSKIKDSSSSESWIDNYQPKKNGFNSKFSKINSKNSKQGYETEQRVLKKLSTHYEVHNVSRNQYLSEMKTGIPDLIVIDHGTPRYIEVKSIRSTQIERNGIVGGRVQFYKPKLKELADKNGLVIIEIRETTKFGKENGKLTYKSANAKDVYKLVKNESPPNVKLERHELRYFKDLDVKNLP